LVKKLAQAKRYQHSGNDLRQVFRFRLIILFSLVVVAVGIICLLVVLVGIVIRSELRVAREHRVAVVLVKRQRPPRRTQVIL